MKWLTIIGDNTKASFVRELALITGAIGLLWRAKSNHLPLKMNPVPVSPEAALEEARRQRVMLLMIVGGIALVLILVAVSS